MKKYLSIIALLLSLQSFSQVGYVGVIYDRANPLFTRPYVVTRFQDPDFTKQAGITPIIGMGINSLGNFSAQFGVDVYQTITPRYKFLIGGGVEVMGYGDVFKEFMPSLRLGLEFKKYLVLLTNNYTFRPIRVFGIKGYEPVLQPGIGLFYKLSKYN